MYKRQDLDKEIMALGGSAIGVVESYGHKIYQIEFVNRVGSVSYTHLDVYKRQILAWLLTEAKSKPDLLSLMKFSIRPLLQ